MVAAPATQLVVTTSPPSSATAGHGFDLTVEAEDPFNNVDLAFGGTVTMAVLNVPAGGSDSLGGIVSMSAVHGVADFTGLTLTKAAQGYTLQAISSALKSAATNSITVEPGAAVQLVVTATPPDSILMGSGFTVTVAAEDQYNNVDPSFTGTVSVAIAPESNPGSSSLGGPPSATANQGIATFAGLSLNNPGEGYRLQFSGDGFSVVTGPFNVTNPPPEIILANVATMQKHNRKGKPIGKPMFAGFAFQYSESMSSSASLASDYVVDMFVVKRVRRKNVQTLQPVSFSPSYSAFDQHRYVDGQQQTKVLQGRPDYRHRDGAEWRQQQLRRFPERRR